ncbi:SIS domain-containing protein [Leptospira santarosai]|uniref:Phosphoheptose isomerase family protein n=1 Tax=Leptospira santarosai str. MOR084 TaxID=1049984 RepID=A0A0E2BID5_9LEPT|nr:SIS domain-containing protein [Leptospira santarosai]EKO34686.1 phosphoheptose isomerase family protein [Leptospira santarosai str. MOR084]EKR91424.1 phosphoheptose isomerase family protein [Leptospira santarosai str. CBC379]EMO70445.1 phosphoheptose isomerase family protein [Leptospira santarosai str. 200403458]EMO96847.1 phosphoheptose isomerase family protein [Leptospira santarosai str. 200702252]EMP04101.1 phosphoheptose isomerase family protein [Leptospira santarosai str. HAI1380]
MNLFEKAKNFSKTFQQESIEAIQNLDLDAIAQVAVALYEAKENDKNIFFFGNGGSHGIASHLACDFGKGTKNSSKPNQKYYKVFGLDNAAWLTAQANDGKEPFILGNYPGTYTHGYDGVFVGQMENFINPGDIAFGISSSGNSPNVINALLFAKEKGAKTIAMVGFDGGQALKIADMTLFVPSTKGKYGIVEGVHEVVHHLLYEFAVLLEK